MAANQPMQGGAGESMADFVRRRNREAATRQLAQAAGHDAYGRAIRTNEDVDLRQPGDVSAYGAGTAVNDPAPAAKVADPAPNFAEAEPIRVSHPGFAESLIPVWGSGREALADLGEGDYAGAALNGALAASDLFLVGDIWKAIGKGGLYAVKGAIGEGAVGAKWKNVRRKMGKLEMLDPYQHGHHWFIPQNGWGKAVPDAIKNHPANILGMPSREVHGRLHGPYKGQPRYGLLERYGRGTPTWSKVATGSAVAHPVAAVKAEADGE